MATEPLDFKVAKKKRKIIEFRIEGDDFVYSFTTPKTAGLVLDITAEGSSEEVASTRAMLNWLSRGLPEDQNQRLMDRLRDPDDDLDFEELGEYVEKLMEEVNGNPTG